MHQATGTVVSFTDTNLLIAKGRGKKKTKLTFVRNSKTTTQGTLTKGAKVTVRYYEAGNQRIAKRIKVLEVQPKGKPATSSKAAKPNS